MELLKDGGKVLVVGGRGANFPPELRDHPRLTFWDSTEESLKREVPGNVKALVFTRFVSHALSGKLIATARKRRITIFNGQGTGEIKKTIEDILGGTAKELPTVSRFVEEHADLTKGATEESKRLLAEMQKLGMISTEGSIQVAIGKLKKKKGLSRRKSPKAPTPPPAFVTTLPPLPPKPTLDGAFTILEEGISALQLALEGFRQLVVENKKLTDRLEAIRQSASMK